MFATFFISPGRCGTQWIASALRRRYGDMVCAVHEPLGWDYCSRQLFSGVDLDSVETSSRLRDHVRRIEQAISPLRADGGQRYVETGWPAYGAIPYLFGRLERRIRIVHIVRDPVVTASSMLTHNYYGPEREALFTRSLTTPMDPNSAFPELAATWEEMSQYEKCLYFWAELNSYALRLEEQSGAPWLRLKFEAFFGPGDGELTRLLDFIGLPRRSSIFGDRRQPIDRYHYRSGENWNPSAIEKFPRIVELAGKLGYRPDETDPSLIRSRYRTRNGERAPRILDRPSPK